MKNQVAHGDVLKVQTAYEQTLVPVLNVADMAISRTYLSEYRHYDVVNLEKGPSDALLPGFTACSKLFRLKRFVYNPEENIAERLKTFYLSLSHLPLNPNVFMVIRNEPPTYWNPQGGFAIHLGIRTEAANASYQIEKMLEESFLGTFLGSELESVAPSDVFPKTAVSNLSCVLAVPSVKKDTDNETAQMGLEQFIDVMRNKAYTAVFVAAPVTNEVIQQRKRELENFYTKLSTGRKLTVSYGENESASVSKSISDSTGLSQTSGKSFTQTKSQSETQTRGGGTGTSHTSGSSWGSDGSSSSSSTTYSTSRNWSNSQTIGFSASKGVTTSTGKTIQHGIFEGESETKGKTATVSIEVENKNVVGMLEKIDAELKHITESEAYGLWECAAYFTAESPMSARFAANSYKALVLGDTSSSARSYIIDWTVPEAPAPRDVQEQEQRYISELFSYVQHGLHPVLRRGEGYYGNEDLFREIMLTQSVSGKDLPYFLPLPLKSVPGVVVDSIASFERSVHVKKISGDDLEPHPDNKRVRLGCVFHMGLEEYTSEVSLELDKFTSHCFISGSTGSGKSNTMARLLEEIIQQNEQKVNFLVIEPAKGEYKKDFHEVPDINIFSTNPLCERLLHLNPFRFHPGIHVLEHLDRLLNIFGSCWELTEAMPAILKKAVERAYESVGWDLCNSYYIGEGRPKFPTFATVVEELRRVIDESDYSAEVKSNYTGALVTRVESLAGGILRRIFCGEVDVSYETLFDGRTIVDLSRLGSQETKTLIMGVLVMLLSEYRMAVAQAKNETNKKLQHITVIEEAHNLLKSSDASAGGSNVAAKSIEMISNAIAEMRTYGEGFIIVDQSPTAVDISAIKNTNTKIVMRLPEQHDCEAMASAMGLNEHQQKEIAKLLPGKAIVMQNDWTAAVMVAIDKAESNYGGEPEIISPEGNRMTRGCLARAFADIACTCYAGLANREDVLTPEMKIKGHTVREYWNWALGFLSVANRQFKESGTAGMGIGKAKARELVELCVHHFRANKMDALKRTEILAAYGRLIVSLLECENCWKVYFSQNSAWIRLGRNPKDAMASLEAERTGGVPFTKVMKRYLPPFKDNEIASICRCVKSFLRTADGMMFAGGTCSDCNLFVRLTNRETKV